MARIRTVKPDFFRHELLQELELKHPGKYCMLVFAGLFTVADREGRFEWRPRRIKLDVLPFLDFDMAETMAILLESGFIERYEIDSRTYGFIVAWERHQIVNRDEPPSEIPAPNGSMTIYFRPPNQTQRMKIYARDGWVCQYCNRTMRDDRRAACLDHVIPYSRGGTNREQNLATSCKRCNAIKADRTPTEAAMPWPKGLGEAVVDGALTPIGPDTGPPVNRVSANGPHPPDKEWEREEEKEGKRNGHATCAREESRAVASDREVSTIVPHGTSVDQTRPEARAQLSPEFDEDYIERTFPPTSHDRNVVAALHSAMGIVGAGLATEADLRRRLEGFRDFATTGGYSGPAMTPGMSSWFAVHQRRSPPYWAQEWAAVPTKAEQQQDANADAARRLLAGECAL